MYGYIYKTTNLVNGKIYIGKHKAPEFDETYKGSGVVLWRAINKYGIENFRVEFVIPCFSKEELNTEEKFLIEWFDSRNPKVGYNLSKGGDGGMGLPAGRKLSATHRLHLSESHRGKSRSLESRIKQGNSIRGENNCNYGKPMDEATKNKIRESRSWYRPSDETKAKVSQAMSGENNPFYGKKHDESARKKMSDAAKARHADPNYVDPRKGTTRSAETKARISEARKNQKFRVKCKQCGQEFLANSPNKYQLCPHCKEVMQR